MQRNTSQLVLIGVILSLSGVLLVGCGGGGSGGSTPNPPPPPPPPPSVEIGPGPGPAADTIPTEPAISTVEARAAAFATAPRSDLVSRDAIERIDQFADDLPDAEAELRAVLADFTGWVAEEPNDAVSQAGLAAATVVVGGYNAGIDAGYTPDQILSLLSPVAEVASAGLRDEPAGLIFAAADFPSPTDPDFSSADLQIGIRKFLLPAINAARDRLNALASVAPSASTRLAEFPSRHGTHYAYQADVQALSSALRIAHGLLLQFCAYQFNPGDWDWTAPLTDRDADGDGELSVEEYLPEDPFLWRHQSRNMAEGGTELNGGLASLATAIEAAPSDSMLAQAVRPDSPAVAAQKLRDLRMLLDREVDVQIYHEGGLEGPGTFTTRMDLSRLWAAPIDDLKTLFPTLRPVSGSAWEALPRSASDFPQPTMGGVFPQPAQVLEMLTTGPTYITITHGSADPIVILDRRSEQ